MSVALVRHQFTVEDYYQIVELGLLKENDQVELINGEIIHMSPIGSYHSGCVKRLNKILNALLNQKAIISVQDPVRIDRFSEPEPDIAVLKLRDDFYTSSHPTPQDVLLIIEISDTTLQYDREIKLPLYAKAGIPEVWIVNIKEERIEVHTQPAKDIYKLQRIVQQEDELSILDHTIAAADILV